MRKLAPVLILLSLAVAAGASEPVDPVEVHRRALVVDAHSDALFRMDTDGSWLADEPFRAQTTLTRLEQGGVDAQFFAVWVPPAYRTYGYARKTLELIERLYREVERTPDRIELARSVADIERIAEAGKVAALIGIEGGHSIENSLPLLRIYHRLGVRYMTLTWSNNTDWADSSGDVAAWDGLSDFGVKVVAEMNRLGMLVDVSHVSDATFWDVMRVSRAPVIASHSSCRALCDAGRNMSDEMIVALAGNGGVIQINFYAAFLDQAFRDAANRGLKDAAGEIAALGDRYLGDEIRIFKGVWSVYERVDAALEPPPLSVLVDHIDHVVRLVGPDHVGLGSDFDGVTALPRGLEHAGRLPALTAALLDRGYAEETIDKILGRNLMRVMAAAESVARQQPGDPPEVTR